jgi:hypothetical protein
VNLRLTTITVIDQAIFTPGPDEAQGTTGWAGFWHQDSDGQALSQGSLVPGNSVLGKGETESNSECVEKLSYSNLRQQAGGLGSFCLTKKG